MKLQTLFPVLGLAAAAPTPAADATSSPFSLQAKYIAGNTAFANQFLISYHTGAGFNTVVTTNITGAGDVFTLVNGQAVSNLGTTNPYSLALTQPVDFYAGWGDVSLNLGSQNAGYGFAINSAGHFVGLSSEFTGWRVCRWWHFAPELFHDTPEAEAGDIPLNCATVYLVPVYTS